ncbi:acVLRF1 family peptidyl-tRNA hydrolase [Micropruina sp.]|uniref:acVLRF1 family peptidyl-tRNA hydrolase n=1 Tax=Micropruina sp. TaxID=2737536 RepID=UPI0039E254D8
MQGLHRVLIAPERLAGWLAGFAERHGPPVASADAAQLTLVSPDAAEAVIDLIWGPLPGLDPIAELLAQVSRPRRLGALLLRRSAHAVGVFDATELLAHSLGRHYVQGRTKAGGWSQQRYARRRANQAERAYDKASEAAVSLLVPRVGELDGLLLGGDARALRQVLDTPELAPLAALAQRNARRPLPVADPNLRVLRDALAQFLAVPIGLNQAARATSALAQRDDQAGQ